MLRTGDDDLYLSTIPVGHWSKPMVVKGSARCGFGLVDSIQKGGLKAISTKECDLLRSHNSKRHPKFQPILQSLPGGHGNDIAICPNYPTGHSIEYVFHPSSSNHSIIFYARLQVARFKQADSSKFDCHLISFHPFSGQKAYNILQQLHSLHFPSFRFF